MYRRYIVVGIVFFLLVGAYFMFFDKKENKNYEKYYNKLVSHENFKSYLDHVNLNIEEIEEDEEPLYLMQMDYSDIKVDW